MNPEQQMQEILNKATATIEDVTKNSNAVLERVTKTSEELITKVDSRSKKQLNMFYLLALAVLAFIVQIEVKQSHSLTREEAQEIHTEMTNKFVSKKDALKAFELQASNTSRLWALASADSSKIAEYNSNYLWLIQTLFDSKTRGK